VAGQDQGFGSLSRRDALQTSLAPGELEELPVDRVAQEEAEVKQGGNPFKPERAVFP
jgi:hypothetical protein